MQEYWILATGGNYTKFKIRRIWGMDLILKKLIEISEKILADYNIHPNEIIMETTTHSLYLDSLDMVELIMDIENEFDCYIDDEAAASFYTVGDIVEFLKKS